MATETVLDGLLERHRALDQYLRMRDEFSMAFEAEVTFKKLFVVACGSFFEAEVTAVLERWAARYNDVRLTTFIRKRALDRKYHDLFDWTVKNANKFFGFFGDTFKEETLGVLRDDHGIAVAVQAFMELGALRNVVAHNFAAASVDKTTAELEDLYRKGLGFIDYVANCLGVTQGASGAASEGA